VQPKSPLNFILSSLVFLMLSVPAFAQGSTPTQPAATCKEYTALGKLYYSKADYQAAYVVFRNCLVLEPKNTDALYNLARVELHLRLYQAAITHMKTCIDVDGQYWRCYLVLAQTYVSQYTDSSDRVLQKGQLDEALRVLDDAERIVTNNEAKAAVNNLRGTIYKYKKEPENAVKFFKQALQFAPEDPIVLFNLGALYLQLSKYDEAADVLRQALDAKPSDFITQAFYCKALRLSGKTNEAITVQSAPVKTPSWLGSTALFCTSPKTKTKPVRCSSWLSSSTH
jgi:tetratricopeptide (TPR) repeat protein